MTIQHRGIADVAAPSVTAGFYLPEPPEWVAQGLCAQTDPEEFFPNKGGSSRAAKNVCAACDVRLECLEYALVNEERYGIWGGLSERERRALSHSLRPVPANGNTHKTHCVNEHEFTPDNTYWRPGGGRACRTCLADSTRRYKEKKTP